MGKKPVYLLGRRTHTSNGLKIDDDTGDEEDTDEEVRKGHSQSDVT